MKIELASSYGFCFGVKRAIEIAQKYENSATMGPLIHNEDEINRLKKDFNVGLYSQLSDVKPDDTVIIRTHGIPKNDLKELKKSVKKVINATCPFVTTPQNIVKNMSKEGYSILIFGDIEHPEVKGVKSYADDLDDVHIILSVHDLKNIKFKNNKITLNEIPKKFIKTIIAWSSEISNDGEFIKGKEPWNKGKKYSSTNHLKVSKTITEELKQAWKNTSERAREKYPEIDVFDINMNFLGR